MPAGGLNASAVDLAKFVAMVFADGQANGHAVLQPATLHEMLRARRNPRLHWMVICKPGWPG